MTQEMNGSALTRIIGGAEKILTKAEHTATKHHTSHLV